MRTGINYLGVVALIGLLAACSSQKEAEKAEVDPAAQPSESKEQHPEGASSSMEAETSQGSSAENEVVLSAKLTDMLAGFSAEERARTNPLAGNAEAIEKGRSEYQSMCFVCHGSAGKGDGPASKATPNKPTDLSDPARAALLTSGERFLVLRNGIPGTSMPASGANLNDEQVWRIVSFVETLSN